MEYKLLALVLLISAVRVQGISSGVEYTEYVRYLAGLYDYNQTCSGFILSRKAILTAAHCVEKINVLAILYTSTFGDIQVISRDDIETPIILHPSYNNETYENDFAVVTLSKNLTIFPNSNLTTSEIEVNTKCFVSGYGVQDEGDNESSFPRFKEVEVIACDVQSPGRICAVGQINNTYKAGVLCDGDAGAPLVCNKELVGIAVSDNNCGTGSPDVYQSVMGFQAWIEEQIDTAAQEETTSTSTSTSTTTRIPTTTRSSTSSTTGEPGSASTSVLNPLIMIATLSVILKMTITQHSI